VEKVRTDWENLASIVCQNDKAATYFRRSTSSTCATSSTSKIVEKTFGTTGSSPSSQKTSRFRAQVVPTNFSGMNHWRTPKFELGRRLEHVRQPKPELQSVIDTCWTAIDSENVMAVHIRGTDKWRECCFLQKVGPSVKKHLDSDMPADKVLLVTDW